MGWKAGWDATWEADWYLYDEGTGFPGFGPDGVATFTLDLERGFKLTLTWDTSIVGHADGTEQRISNLDRPIQHYDGSALLLGNLPRQTRARLARYAAQGATFLLGLPHEALPLVADAVDTVITVPADAMARCDSKQIGQRVVVLSADRKTAVDAVIQAEDGGAITLDVAPGAAGALGGTVMPAMAVLLEPQQDFNRFKIAAERWSISARAAIFDFAQTHGEIDLGAIKAAWAGARIVARQPGLSGNAILFALDSNAGNPDGGALVETVGTATTAQMKGDTDTLADLATLLDTSSNVKLVGDYNAAALIATGDSVAQNLAGGQAGGAMGTGAALMMYDGHPVWDRKIRNPGTISDPVHGMTEILDLGGVPYAIGQTTYPAWGRTAAIESDDPAEWSWLKLMLATLRGAQRVFWLPTWRADLTWVSTGAVQPTNPPTTPLVVRSDDDSDITAWYPAQRDRIMVRQVDGTVTYAQITGTPVDNGDGTQTLTITAALSGEDVAMVSWLEPARFEGDMFTVTFAGTSFAMSAMARAHAVSDLDLLEVEA